MYRDPRSIRPNMEGYSAPIQSRIRRSCGTGDSIARRYTSAFVSAFGPMVCSMTLRIALFSLLVSIVVPAANRVDLEESPRIPQAVREQTVRFANDIDQAIQIAFGVQA